MFLTIISFLLVLSVLVLIHELGHFFVAKKFGVKVEEFGFGFPPRIFGKKIGETVYSINWLPIGGFVKLYGEDDAGGGKLTLKDKGLRINDKYKKRAFYARPAWQRAAIVVAGVVMNFFLAAAILTYLFAVVGVSTPGKNVLIAAVAKNSPAAHAGLMSGDVILAIDSHTIVDPLQLITYTKRHLGQQVTVRIKDKGSRIKDIIITPRVHYPTNEGAMGVAIGQNVIIKKYPWYQAPFFGTREAFSESIAILIGLRDAVVQFATTHQAPAGLAGPIGIAQVTGQFVRIGFDAVLSLVATLSINLAVLNILPIPALDGGRLFFILVELFTRKKVHPKFEAYAHTVGMAVLLTLIVLITFHDITRVLAGQPVLP